MVTMKKAAAIAALAAAALLPSGAQAAWRRAETANFVVYSQGSEAELRADAALLEDYNAFLRLLTGIADPPPPTKLDVYEVRGHNALKLVRPDIAEDVAGFYTATGSGIAAFVDNGASQRGPEENQILLHEIAHHFMLQYRPSAYPPWYVEGFAEYVMTATFEKDRIEFGQASTNRASWLMNASWLPLDQILFQPPPRDGTASALYYAESWLLVHYLLRDSARKAKLVDYLTSTARGEAPKAAFQRIFAVDPKVMQKDMLDYGYKHMTYSRLKRQSATTPPAIAITQLPASADDLLLAQAAMEVGVSDEAVPALLARVRAAAAKNHDSYSTRVLAEAEALYGDSAAADRLLDPLLAASPNDAELLYWEGMRHLVAARRDDSAAAKEHKLAQTWFVKAHKADPDQFQTLARYAESLVGESRFLTENTTNVMLLAHQLAPQVNEITMNAANMLLMRGKYDEAAALLTPLASSPHEPEMAAVAQAMLARAKAKGAPGAEPIVPPKLTPPPPLGPGKR
ncbi:MAG TPA: hypothetical protein VGD66_15585 [Allosphingosinicella sp.]|jgi:hypothetical protein